MSAGPAVISLMFDQETRALLGGVCGACSWSLSLREAKGGNLYQEGQRHLVDRHHQDATQCDRNMRAERIDSLRFAWWLPGTLRDATLPFRL